MIGRGRMGDQRGAAMTSIREQLFSALAELREHSADVRMGQLIANLATLARGAEVEAQPPRLAQSRRAARGRLPAHTVDLTARGDRSNGIGFGRVGFGQSLGESLAVFG